jgi:uncharacterized membrane protein
VAKHAVRRTFANRRVVAGVLVAMVAVAGVVAWLTRSTDPLVRPSDTCASPPPLKTVAGVTLQPVAMRAFRKAQRLAHGQISVVQSYRSCDEQAKACRNICGNANGCPGTCASPGSSYHQLGAAVDVTQGTLDAPGVIRALERAGWCESEPNSDPGHFSFDGCH